MVKVVAWCFAVTVIIGLVAAFTLGMAIIWHEVLGGPRLDTGSVVFGVVVTWLCAEASRAMAPIAREAK